MEQLIINQTNMLNNPETFNLQQFRKNTKEINSLYKKLPKSSVRLNKEECNKYSEILNQYQSLNMSLKEYKETPKLKAIIDYTYDMTKNVNTYLKLYQCYN